jgi:rubredoxin
LSSSPGAGRRFSIERTLARRTRCAHRGRGAAPHALTVATFPPVKWMCESCGFIYDPAEGDPDGGIPPGTAFDDIPDTWFCPVCGARKRDFTPYED